MPGITPKISAPASDAILTRLRNTGLYCTIKYVSRKVRPVAFDWCEGGGASHLQGWQLARPLRGRGKTTRIALHEGVTFYGTGAKHRLIKIFNEVQFSPRFFLPGILFSGVSQKAKTSIWSRYAKMGGLFWIRIEDMNSESDPGGKKQQTLHKWTWAQVKTELG